MRRTVFLVWCMLFFATGAVSASTLLQADQCSVPADQVIEGNLYVLCQNLLIEGHVTGDVVGAALVADINGRVDGSLYLASVRLNVRGAIGQDVHAAGPVIAIRPEARLFSPNADVYSFALTTRLEAPMTGSVNAAGYELHVGAPVSGHIDYAGSSLTVDAPVGGSVLASVGSSTDSTLQLRSVAQWIEPEFALGDPGLRVTANAAIGGRLVYSAPAPGIILGPVGESVTFLRVAARNDIDPDADFGSSVSRYIEAVLRDYIATLLIGGLLVLVLPRAVRLPSQTLVRRPLPSFSVGLITFVLSFPAFLLAGIIGLSVVLLISLLGFPDFTITAAFVIGLVVVAAAALFYFTAVLVSRAVVAVTVARPVARRFRAEPGGRIESLIALAIGGLVLALLSALPVIGLLVTALITFIGLGAMIIALRRNTGARDNGNGNGAADDEPPHAPPPPPLLPRGPGTDNLPDGFNWWS